MLPVSLAAGTLCLAGGGVAIYTLMTGEETPKRRVSAIRIGPLPDMPDLRDGVPALMPTRHPTAAASAAGRLAGANSPAGAAGPSAAPTMPPLSADDANRKAMASTIASAGLRPALPGQTEAKPADVKSAVAKPVSAVVASAPTPMVGESPAAKTLPEPVVAPNPPMVAAAEPPQPPQGAVDASARTAPGTVRRIDIKPTETASLGDARPVEPSAPATAPVPIVPPPPPRAAPEAGPAPSSAAPEPARAEPVMPAATAPTRSASLPADAPLPPPRPSFQPPDPVERAAPRPAGPERAATPKPRPAAPTRAAAASPAGQPAVAERRPAADADEDRSLLGIPVPKFVPSGRDIRDAASSITDAVTSLPSRF